MRDKRELPLLLPLIEHDAQAARYEVASINYDKLLGTLERCLDHAAIFVAETDEKLVGMMIMCLVESYWSDNYTLANLIYWVEPDYRNSRHGSDLLKASTDYAKQRGLPFKISVESYEDLSRKDAFFVRYGFKPCGGNYLLRSD